MTQGQKIYNSEVIKSVFDLYNSGLSLHRVGNKLDISHCTVRDYLHRAGVKRRPRGNYKTCSLNESAFEEINPESSYWIGMLNADGNVHHRKKSDSDNISLGLKDKEHVEKFKKFMNSGHKIWEEKKLNKRTGKYTYSAKLTFTSKKIAQDLANWSIEPRKSCKEKVHPVLKYNRDFWRGMFDGDGCFSFKKTGQLFCYLLGSNNVIEKFIDFLDSHKIKYGKIRKRKSEGLYDLNISSKRKGRRGSKGNQLEDYIHIHKFYNLLYEDAFIYLNRKRNYFEKTIREFK